MEGFGSTELLPNSKFLRSYFLIKNGIQRTPFFNLLEIISIYFFKAASINVLSVYWIKRSIFPLASKCASACIHCVIFFPVVLYLAITWYQAKTHIPGASTLCGLLTFTGRKI